MSMEISGLGASAPMDRQTFGAAVATETLNMMNNAGSGTGPAPVDRPSAEASLVNKTFDFMNSGSAGNSSGMAESYDFQTSVLGAHAMGALVNAKI